MRTKKGVVVSAKMQNTIVVEVVTYVEHALYKKSYKKSSRFYVDNPGNVYKEGDVVTIFEVSPISKKKRWKVLEEVVS